MTTMLADWTEAHNAKFQSSIMTFQHNLASTGLFEDAALIELLKDHPAHMLDVCTMGASDDPRYPNKFRTGDFRDVPAQVLLDAAKAGKVWINARNAMNHHPAYREVLETMYGELSAATGNRAFNPKGGILISSPVAKVPYHFDKTETILWHVRGQKTIYLWPVNQRFIPDTAHEATLTDLLDDDLPYRAEFDDEATVIDLQPGQAATWPLNSPHRVDNKTFCVSVTTEYSTRESGMKNAAMLTNGALRRYLKMNPSYEKDGLVKRQVKSVAGRVIRKAGLMPSTSKPDMVTFKLDPKADSYLVDVEPVERSF